MLDFAQLPPEINSALMYTGPGSAPMLTAATAWEGLATDLQNTASAYRSLITGLTEGPWQGPAALSMAAAAASPVGWLGGTAGLAEQAATQAGAAVAAYEAAFAATVPPPMIAANRTLLATLVATNVLGVNSAAIAATEAQYAEMWVQDATMMATYQAASAAAGVLTPVTPLTSTTNPAAAATVNSAALAADSTGGTAQALTAPLTTAPALAAPTLPFTTDGLLSSVDNFLGTPSVFNAINGGVNTGAWFTMNAIPNAVQLGRTLGTVQAIPFSLADSVAPATGAAAVTPGTMVGSVSGALGEASAVGGLSVPAGWNAAAPASLASATAPLGGSGWTAAAEAEGVTAMPGMPGMAAAAKGAGGYGTGPRYGFKPIVMPKQVVV